MAKALISRRAVFSASHRLHSPELSDEENRKLFGKCNYPGGHGHNYVIEVTVKGEVEGRSGVVLNLSDLKEAIREAVIEPMDHRHLNADVPEFADLNPTAENIAIVCWRRLQELLPEGSLHEVLIRETENNVAIYRGE